MLRLQVVGKRVRIQRAELAGWQGCEQVQIVASAGHEVVHGDTVAARRINGRTVVVAGVMDMSAGAGGGIPAEAQAGSLQYAR